ncbi:MAG: TrkA C-terminal domain-containing protein [Nitrospiraceae bacterium]
MNLELLGRVHKELAITGSAFYEAILAISERVNRKVQIIRLHWQAATLLQRMDHVTSDVGQQIVDQVSRRFLASNQPDSVLGPLDATLSRASVRVHELKQSLVRVDAQIRDLKLEAIHEDLLHLQRDLSLRSAGIERLVIVRGAAAVGQPVRALPRSSSVHIAAILRGPFLLAPAEDLVFRSDDIVVLVGIQADLDQFVAWFTSKSPLRTPTTKSA